MAVGDRRSEPRQSLGEQWAWVVGDKDQTPIAVVLLNISKSGANLLAEDAVPAEFTLYLTRDGQVQRRCRVVWRSDESIGVSIIPDRKRPRTATTRSFVIE